ncbi:hypothetical protein TgHK011_005723 [Trichoderma gracile]|nr:hypothetical protein TgHK011_005723 [Trichoderma gracile]
MPCLLIFLIQIGSETTSGVHSIFLRHLDTLFTDEIYHHDCPQDERLKTRRIGMNYPGCLSYITTYFHETTAYVSLN